MAALSDLRAAYQSRLDSAARRARSMERRGFWLSNVRLVAFLGALGLAIATWAGKLPHPAWAGAAGCLALFLAAAVAYDKALAEGRRAQAKAELGRRGLLRLDDRFADLPENGSRFADTAHPYSADLDLFGAASVFQRLDATATRPGEETLARWLKEAALPDQVARRQQAARELVDQIDLRQAIQVEGRLLSEDKPDPSRLIAWAEGPGDLRWPGWRLVAWILPACTVAGWLAASEELAPRLAWAIPLALQLGVVALTYRAVRRVYRKLRAPGEKLLSYEHLFAAVERLEPQSDVLRDLMERSLGCARDSGDRRASWPSGRLRTLGRAIAFLQAREQPLFHLPLNLLLLWDLHFATALERWRARSGGRLRRWFDAVGSLEALSSLAGFAFENPGFAWPALDEEPAAHLVAEGLGHPLLPATHRVVNDVSLPCPGSLLLISGSNMAGKTTLLRALGVNAVLAQAGGPVCARSMSLSPLQVATSMRVQDSLARGLSFFYAELERLKAVLDLAKEGPTLVLLDEVLQGTNTAERQAASRAIVHRLVELGAVGGIATHDLGLATLEVDTDGKVRNVHFTDQIVDGEMLFDYRLRPGVVSTTNALALLSRVGIDLEIPDKA